MLRKTASVPLALALALGSTTANAEDTQGPRAFVSTPRATRFSVVVNPSLTLAGKTGARAEVAITDVHAIFVEPSYLSRYVSQVDRQVTAVELDFGYHLFPQARGARGFYVGPRGLFASGGTYDVDGAAWGAGVDLGYVWTWSGGPALNLGAGVAYYHVTAHAKPGTVPEVQLLDPAQRAQIEGATVGRSGLLPMGMAGLGLAF